MTERALQECVRKLAKLTGCLYYHTHDSRHSTAGYPDCTIVTADNRLVFAELKSEKGKLTVEQGDWLRRLRATGAEAHVWFPLDWKNGTIEQVLKPQARKAEAVAGPVVVYRPWRRCAT